MRATECACNVELIKEFDKEYGCKVTTALSVAKKDLHAYIKQIIITIPKNFERFPKK